ncbi:MAG: GTPase ObgE [Clostridia bacterium]|nr:GTPase ObgE [Clostridia bacterium]
MFLDKVKISIKAGNGGKGCVSFYHSKQTINGGPDGGEGGNGGSIIFKATNNQNTLYNFKFKRKFEAENGQDGMGKKSSGKKGADKIIEVPCGTVISDAESGKVIADLHNDGDTFVALKGGAGGHGNMYYATATRQAPRFSQTGEVVKEREVILELKTIADVGLVGYPNVGKSTLLSVISNARPKIANYAFTTLVPNLGVVQFHENTFVVADIPGLIEGASEGVGLGHEFLKHIERVRLILHLVDISESEGRNAIEDFKTINEELLKYSKKLANLEQIIVLTKCDLLPEEEKNLKIADFEIELNKLKKSYKHMKNGVEILPISSVAHQNIENLKAVIWQKLETIPKTKPIQIEDTDFDKRDRTSLNIERADDGAFVVSGGYVDNLVRGIVLSDYKSFAYFQMRLKNDGVIQKLLEEGMKEGDTVRIKDIEFVYEV